MAVVVLLGLSWFCAPLGALVLDFNNIKSSADIQGARKGAQCLSDNDCNTRKFCLKLQDEKPFCATCRGLERRCPRNAMCCPGTLCLNDICTTMEDAVLILERQIHDNDDIDTKGTTESPVQENKPKRKPNIKSQGSQGQEGGSCLRTFDCTSGLCCAHHFWTKIYKPVFVEGQVYSRRGHRYCPAPEIFPAL